MKYTTRINPYTKLECKLPTSATKEQWEKQFIAQKIMLEQLALLEKDSD